MRSGSNSSARVSLKLSFRFDEARSLDRTLGLSRLPAGETATITNGGLALNSGHSPSLERSVISMAYVATRAAGKGDRAESVDVPFRLSDWKHRVAGPRGALMTYLTPSSTARRAQAGSDVRARSARRGARVIAPAPSSPDFVLEAQPPAQPHRRVSIERPPIPHRNVLCWTVVSNKALSDCERSRASWVGTAER